jgi:PAS domain S-box-containing protein
MAAWLGGDLEKSLEEINVPAALVDKKGVVRWMNASAREAVGDVRGRPILEVVPPESRRLAHVEQAKLLLGSKPVADYSSVARTRGGKRMPVEVNLVALRDGERVVGIYGVARPQASTAAAPAAGPLTPRQHEVLQALARGESTAQIAERLVISPETVRNHVRGVLRALRVHSRLEAVVEARRRGLLD